jgi:hypothetical protein
VGGGRRRGRREDILPAFGLTFDTVSPAAFVTPDVAVPAVELTSFTAPVAVLLSPLTAPLISPRVALPTVDPTFFVVLFRVFPTPWPAPLIASERCVSQSGSSSSGKWYTCFLRLHERLQQSIQQSSIHRSRGYRPTARRPVQH